MVGTRAVAASGDKEKIDGGTSTCVYRHDTAIMQERAGCRRTTLALSYLSLAARTRGALCVAGVVMLCSGGKVVLRVRM